MQLKVDVLRKVKHARNPFRDDDTVRALNRFARGEQCMRFYLFFKSVRGIFRRFLECEWRSTRRSSCS